MFAENLNEIGYVWWFGSGFFFRIHQKKLNLKVAHCFYKQLLFNEFLKFWGFIESTRENTDFLLNSKKNLSSFNFFFIFIKLFEIIVNFLSSTY
jgi:hypothetical protein